MPERDRPIDMLVLPCSERPVDGDAAEFRRSARQPADGSVARLHGGDAQRPFSSSEPSAISRATTRIGPEANCAARSDFAWLRQVAIEGRRRTVLMVAVSRWIARSF
jgi:hypothetical protein